MTLKNRHLTSTLSWKALVAHYKKGQLHLRDIFTKDLNRGEKMTAEAAGLFLDYSKNRVTDETLSLLFNLATESGLKERIGAMFGGEKITVLFFMWLCGHPLVQP